MEIIWKFLSFIENSFIQPLVFFNTANAICPTYEVDKNVKICPCDKSSVYNCKNVLCKARAKILFKEAGWSIN